MGEKQENKIKTKINDDKLPDDDKINEILEQLKVLETNDILLNTKDIIDLKIVFNDDENENEENEQKEISSTFPIPFQIKIDLNDIFKKTETEKRKKKTIQCRTPPIERKNKLKVDKSPDSFKKSPRKKKLEKAFRQKIPTKNVEPELDVKEQDKNDPEISLLVNCLENNLTNFASSAQQTHSLCLLLKMKNFTKEQIKEKLQENKDLKQNIESIHNTIEWIREIIIDSHYSHSVI